MALLMVVLSFLCLNGQDSLHYFRARNQLAPYLRHNWDRQNELESADAALKILDQTLKNLWRQPKNAAEAEELLWVQLSRADYLFQQGKVLESIQAFEAALHWHQRYRFPDMVEYLYKPLIAHYTRLGENEKARVLYEKAFAEAAPESLPGLYNNLGLTYWNEGRNAEALTFFQKGLQIKTLSADQKGLLLLSTARSQFELGKTPQARTALQQSLQALESIQEKDETILDYLAGAYTLQGLMQRQSGNFASAEQSLQKARQLALQVYGAQHREYGKINMELAHLFLQKKEPDRALSYCNAALQAVIPGFKSNDPLVLPKSHQLYEENTLYEALASKAEALQQLYQQKQQIQYLSTALACHQLAQEVEINLRNTLQFESSKLTLLAYSRQRMEAALGIAYLLYQKRPSPQLIETAWTMVEQNKAAVLLEAVQENRLKQAFNQGDTLLQKEILLRKRIAWLEREALSTSNDLQAQNYQRQAAQTRDELAKVKTALSKKYPAYAHLKNQLAKLDFQVVRQKLLKKEQAFVLEYYLGTAVGYTFCMSAQGELQWVQISEIEALRSKFGQFLNLIQDKSGGDLQVYQTLGQELFQSLIPEQVQQQAAPSIVLIPDAWLSALPFETLVASHKKARRWTQVPYWCRTTQIQYGYSLGVLLSQQELSSPKHSSMLAIAPGFEQGQRGLAPLRNSKSEIEQFKGIRKTTFLQQNATWQHFSEKAPDYGILHLATHASADSVHNTAGIEFYERRAFLSDIYALPLHADLVCLSACESGLGEWKQGEGVMSLARAFAYAGAKGLVATLWSVNEVSSSTLFESFYQHLCEGKSKAEALHLAKLDYLNDAEIPAFQKTPYYWAALAYVGEDSVVQMGNTPTMVFVIGGLVLGIGVLMFVFAKKRAGFWDFGK